MAAFDEISRRSNPATFHLPRFANILRYTIYILRAANGIRTYMLVVSPDKGQDCRVHNVTPQSERTWDTVSCSMEKIRLYLMHDITAKHQ